MLKNMWEYIRPLKQNRTTNNYNAVAERVFRTLESECKSQGIEITLELDRWMPDSIFDADLIIDAEDDVFVVTNPFGGFQVQVFDIPGDPLTAHAVPSGFARTDSPWLTCIMINNKGLSFEPGVAGGATMILGGYASGWLSATNLLTLSPEESTKVKKWDLYQ